MSDYWDGRIRKDNYGNVDWTGGRLSVKDRIAGLAAIASEKRAFAEADRDFARQKAREANKPKPPRTTSSLPKAKIPPISLPKYQAPSMAHVADSVSRSAQGGRFSRRGMIAAGIGTAGLAGGGALYANRDRFGKSATQRASNERVKVNNRYGRISDRRITEPENAYERSHKIRSLRGVIGRAASDPTSLVEAPGRLVHSSDARRGYAAVEHPGFFDSAAHATTKDPRARLYWRPTTRGERTQERARNVFGAMGAVGASGYGGVLAGRALHGRGAMLAKPEAGNIRGYLRSNYGLSRRTGGALAASALAAGGLSAMLKPKHIELEYRGAKVGKSMEFVKSQPRYGSYAVEGRRRDNSPGRFLGAAAGVAGLAGGGALGYGSQRNLRAGYGFRDEAAGHAGRAATSRSFLDINEPLQARSHATLEAGKKKYADRQAAYRKELSAYHATPGGRAAWDAPQGHDIFSGTTPEDLKNRKKLTNAALKQHPGFRVLTTSLNSQQAANTRAERAMALRQPDITRHQGIHTEASGLAEQFGAKSRNALNAGRRMRYGAIAAPVAGLGLFGASRMAGRRRSQPRYGGNADEGRNYG